MNNKNSSKGIGRMLVVAGCLALVIVAACAQQALAQQAAPKAEPIVLNFGAFIPGSHPEMIGFQQGICG